MKFIKRNMYTILAIIIFVIVVILFAEFRNLLVPDSGKAVYGDRLNNIEEHKLSDEMFENIETKLKEDERVLEVKNQVHGKIINLIITVSDDLNVSDAKVIANSTVSLFEDNLEYYSLQVYVKKNNAELNNFPIIGYKGTKTDELIFTKDREIVVSEDNNEE